MGITIGDAVLYLKANNSKLAKDLNDAETLVRKWGGKSGEILLKAGTAMTAAFTVPLALFAKQAIDIASSYEESLNKVTVVFGKASEKVVQFTQNSAKGLLMNRQEALEAVGTFGNLFTSMGFTRDKAADFSMQLVKLAADLASFNNIDPNIALAKLRSGLVGEAEPLRELGINLTEAAVKAKAMAMGIYSGTGPIDEQTKVLARMALIMDQTKNAQGDLERTSGGLANQTKILDAQMDNLRITVGIRLLPYVTQLVTALADLLDKFDKLPEGSKNAVVSIGAILLFAGPIATVAGVLKTVGGAILWAIGLLGGGAGLTGVFAGLSSTVYIVSYVLAGLAQVLIGGVAAAIGAVTAPVWLLIAALGVFTALLVTLWPEVSKTFMMIADIIAASLRRAGFELNKFFKAGADWAANLINSMGAWFKRVGNSIVDGLWAGIQEKWNGLVTDVENLLQGLLDSAKAKLGISSPSKAWAMQVGQPSAEGIGQGFQDALPGLAAKIQMALAPLPAMAMGGNISVGHVEYHGKFSQAELAYLDGRSEIIAGRMIERSLK